MLQKAHPSSLRHIQYPGSLFRLFEQSNDRLDDFVQVAFGGVAQRG